MYLVSVFEADSGQAQAQPPMLQTPTAFNSLVRPAEVKFHDDPVVIVKGPLVPIHYQTLNPAPAGPREIHALPLPVLDKTLENCASFVPAPNYIQHQVQPTINPWTFQYQSGPVQPNPGGFHQATMEQHQVPATQFYPIMANQVPMGWASPDISHHLEPAPKNLVWHTLPQLQFHFPINMEPSRSICSSPEAMSPFGGSMSPPPPMYPSFPCCPPQQRPGQISQLSSCGPHEFTKIKAKSKGQKKLGKLKQKETTGKEKINYCKLCKSNKETQATYESHVTVDEKGITRCPVLRALVCPLCGASGDFSHTMKYCPKVLEKKEIEADEKQEKEEVEKEQEEPRKLVPVLAENFSLQEVEQPQTRNLENTNFDQNRSTVGGYFNVKY